MGLWQNQKFQTIYSYGHKQFNKVNIDKQESSLLEQVSEAEKSQIELRKTLEEQYGKISVNLEDGSYEEIKE